LPLKYFIILFYKTKEFIYHSLMVTLTELDIKKIARLARLDIAAGDLPLHAENLSKILDFVEQINKAETNNIKPTAHPEDRFQHLRADEVTEINNKAGLYLVPRVIDACDTLTLLSPRGRDDDVSPLSLGEDKGEG
jgi:aspartyl-tRNA(Asn)/glutamyl-tRNA(Gln) amidotransferase subunit C